MPITTAPSPTPVAAVLELLTLKVDRTTAGLSVSVKSPLLEDYFAAVGPFRAQAWPGVTAGTVQLSAGYYAAANRFSTGDILLQWGSPLNQQADYSQWNFGFLLAKGLRDGITVIDGGRWSNTQAADFASTLRAKVEWFYLTYIRPLSITATILVREDFHV